MKKYIALAVFPILACCNTMENKRPSLEASHNAELKANTNLGYPYTLVDTTTTTSLDVTEDTGSFIGNVGRRQTRDYSTTVVGAGRRGSRVVAHEASEFTDTVFDVGDDVANFGAEQIVTYPGIAVDATGRAAGIGGTLVGATMLTYGNVVDGAWNAVFNGVLGRVVIDTKPYMVGSANDLWAVAGLPGSSWRGPLPKMPPPAYPEYTSGKEVVTFSK
jgi:hypothetical protein